MTKQVKWILVVLVSVVFISLAVFSYVNRAPDPSKISSWTKIDTKTMTEIETGVAALVKSDGFADLSVADRADKVVEFLKPYPVTNIAIDFDKAQVTYLYPDGAVSGVMLGASDNSVPNQAAVEAVD